MVIEANADEKESLMLTWLLNNRIEAFQNAWNYDMSYARQMLEASPSALRAFHAATKLGCPDGRGPG